MKFLVAIFLAAAICSCSTTYELIKVEKPNLIGIKSHQIKGTIFKRSYSFIPGSFSVVDSANRFTPTVNDIAQAERILKEQIKHLNKDQPNQFGNCPDIRNNLNSYFRQYVGFYDKEDKVIHVNLLWNKYSIKEKLIGISDPRMSFDDDYTIPFDSCSNYWRLDINLTTNQALNLKVNGVG